MLTSGGASSCSRASAVAIATEAAEAASGVFAESREQKWTWWFSSMKAWLEGCSRETLERFSAGESTLTKVGPGSLESATKSFRVATWTVLCSEEWDRFKALAESSLRNWSSTQSVAELSTASQRREQLADSLRRWSRLTGRHWQPSSIAWHRRSLNTSLSRLRRSRFVGKSANVLVTSTKGRPAGLWSVDCSPATQHADAYANTRLGFCRPPCVFTNYIYLLIYFIYCKSKRRRCALAPTFIVVWERFEIYIVYKRRYINMLLFLFPFFIMWWSIVGIFYHDTQLKLWKIPPNVKRVATLPCEIFEAVVIYGCQWPDFFRHLVCSSAVFYFLASILIGCKSAQWITPRSVIRVLFSSGIDSRPYHPLWKSRNWKKILLILIYA